MNKLESDFEVLIIGGGAAGISAALWCDELGLKTLLLEAKADLGGQLSRVYNPIKNHLGADAENGAELRDQFLKQIENCRFEIRYSSEITDVNATASKVFQKNEKKSLSAKYIVIATGVSRRKLGVEGEEKFKDRGMLESGKRNQQSVAGKRVCIIGGGDAALENALILSETAAHVFLVHRRAEFRARAEFIEKVKANPKVKIITDSIITKIVGDKSIEAVELRNLTTSATTNVPVEKVLTRIGVKPNTEIFRGKLKLDAVGYIEVDALCRTSVENIFAIGDVACPLSPTVSTAVGMGAIAAKVIRANIDKNF